MDLTIFKYQQKEIRTILDKQNNPWFVAKDVFDLLDISWKSHDSIATLSDSMKKKIDISTVNTGVVEIPTGTWLLNEAGVYKVVFRSNKPEAEKFTDWIANDVLPTIRKTGSYIRTNISNPQIELLTNQLSNIIQQNQETFKRLDEIEEQRKLTEEENKDLKIFKQETTQFKRFEKLLEIASTKLSEDSYKHGITPDGFVIVNDIPLDREAWNTLIRRTASFYRQLEGENPPRNESNRFIYAGKKVSYIMAVLNLIMEGI